jgi:hypothetical protein
MEMYKSCFVTRAIYYLGADFPSLEQFTTSLQRATMAKATMQAPTEPTRPADTVTLAPFRWLESAECGSAPVAVPFPRVPAELAEDGGGAPPAGADGGVDGGVAEGGDDDDEAGGGVLGLAGGGADGDEGGGAVVGAGGGVVEGADRRAAVGSSGEDHDDELLVGPAVGLDATGEEESARMVERERGVAVGEPLHVRRRVARVVV